MPQTETAPQTNEKFERALEIYKSIITPEFEKAHWNEIIAFDLESGDYEITKDRWAAGEAIKARHPGVVPFTLRVGPIYMYRHGFHRFPR